MPVVSAARARAYGMRSTPDSPAPSSSFARSWTQRVMSVSAGPPFGGLYLKPPSAGGLCDGVITTPSAKPPAPPSRPWLCARIACESAGVGVYVSRESTRTVTPFAANTSSAETNAGSDSACVSLARKSGPSVPACRRYSQIAWLVARMWSSLNARPSDEPRWPEVPKATRWSGTLTSGCPA